MGLTFHEQETERLLRLYGQELRQATHGVLYRLVGPGERTVTFMHRNAHGSGQDVNVPKIALTKLKRALESIGVEYAETFEPETPPTPEDPVPEKPAKPAKPPPIRKPCQWEPDLSAQKLAAWRGARSTAEVGLLVGCSGSAWKNWESGKSAPSRAMQHKVRQAMSGVVVGALPPTQSPLAACAGVVLENKVVTFEEREATLDVEAVARFLGWDLSAPGTEFKATSEDNKPVEKLWLRMKVRRETAG